MTLRKKIVGCCAGMICLYCTGVWAGPFGLDMGQDVSQLDGVVQEDLALHMYMTRRPPKPHSAFEAYVLKAPPSTGLCRISAVGKNVSTSVYGYELKSSFENVRDQINKVYGNSKIADFLRHDSIWDEPNDWLTGLRKKERVLQASWNRSSGARLKDGISEILLSAIAKKNDTGYFVLQYRFENYDACKNALAEEESDAF